jgi:hypothetical protein
MSFYEKIRKLENLYNSIIYKIHFLEPVSFKLQASTAYHRALEKRSKKEDHFIMISELQYIRIALAFPNTEQVKHFDRIGFKVRGKRMFSTYLDRNNTTNLFLTPAQQKHYCEKDPDNFYPVPNKWGERGATTVELDTISRDLLIKALTVAYQEVNMPKEKKKKTR